jgi:hypothetical protein
VAPGDDADRPAVRRIQELSLVYRTQRLTAPDGDSLVLDEHGRPIEMVYGFACRGAVTEPAEADLATARTQALDAYRRVLATGDDAPVERSEPFRLHSTVRPMRPTSAVRSASAAGPGAVAMPGATAVSAGARPVVDRGRGNRRLLVAAVTVVALAIAVGAWALTRPGTVTAPPALVGQWHGTLTPTSGSSYAARALTVTLTASGPGTADDDVGCHYTMSYHAVANATLTLDAHLDGGSAGCLPPGRVTLSSPTAGATSLHWYADISTDRELMTATGLTPS